MIRHLVLSGAVFLTLVTVVFAENFEGIVHFKSTKDGKVREYSYLIKGGKIRIDLEGEGTRQVNVIVDAAARKTLLLMTERKMVMEFPMEEGQSDASDTTKTSGQLTRTGKADMVLGYPCEQVTYKSEESETEICGAKGLGYFASMQGMRRPGTAGSSDGRSDWVKALRDQGFFPLRVITKGHDGTEKSRLEATTVEKKPLDDLLFTVPPDYKRFDRDKMMRERGSPDGKRGGIPDSGGGDY
jgi:hypothetical protein